MKKRISFLLAMLLCYPAIGWAQTQDEHKMKDEFYKSFNLLNNEKKQALSEKNYNKVEQCIWNIIENYKSLPETVQKGIGLNYGYYYYDIACYQSLQGKIEDALKHFELAFQNGYVNYAHILKDKDLDNIRNQEQFKETLAKIRKEGDYLYILQNSAEYTRTPLQFTYMEPNDSNLIRVRQYFRLDSVAGQGDELSQIKNILTFVHNLIKHDRQHNNP